MKASELHTDILIVGGGPVGLFLAICLYKKGVSCKVLEKRKEPVPDSRSLGIHPVSLELFDKLGICTPFLEAGIPIRNGIALTGSKKIGTLSFSVEAGPHNYILACPQFKTESILRDLLREMDPGALTTEAEYLRHQQSEFEVTTYFRTPDHPSENKITSRYLIACDGKNSKVRRSASIHFSGKRYPDTYIMGDFEDTTPFGMDAVVYLPPEGLIECFPLPDGMRRWVVKTQEYLKDPVPEDLTNRVKKRLGHSLEGVRNTMLSSFGVQHYMAETFAKGRVILAGDAAHVISPIGGQGMNLGWLDAWYLSQILQDEHPDLKSYSRDQQKMAKKVSRRAELNMHLGRRRKLPFFRNVLLRVLLGTPLKRVLTKLFTMRKLESWWI